MKNKMQERKKLRTYDLPELGQLLDINDYILMSLLARRNHLALLVEKYKHGQDDPEAKKIIRPTVETDRIDKAEQWAKDLGLNPHYVRAIMYEIINESCKVQLEQNQNIEALSEEEKKAYNINPNDKDWYELLKNNLIKLTSEIAPRYDANYAQSDSFALKSYIKFENEKIEELIQRLQKDSVPLGLALDLGCATGEISLLLGQYFDKVIGIDISPQMIGEACKKLAPDNNGKINFSIADIEQGLNVPDQSVALIVMNLGTASDILKINALIKEIDRVLVKDGAVFLSFYNVQALVYGFKFIPWESGLNAQINPKANCLDVKSPGNRFYQIYAQPFTIEKVKELFPDNFLFYPDPLTFPTISSILPDYFFQEKILEDKGIKFKIEEVDITLSREELIKKYGKKTYDEYIVKLLAQYFERQRFKDLKANIERLDRDLAEKPFGSYILVQVRKK